MVEIRHVRGCSRLFQGGVCGCHLAPVVLAAYDEAEAENERLRAENEVLRSYLSDDLLRRIAVEHDWPHEPDNERGRWCCEAHRSAFHGDPGSVWGGRGEV